MPMKIVETIVTPLTVKMVLANHDDLELATEWIEFEIQKRRDESERVAVVHREALQYVQNAINTEIQRLRELAGRSA